MVQVVKDGLSTSFADVAELKPSFVGHPDTKTLLELSTSFADVAELKLFNINNIAVFAKATFHVVCRRGRIEAST